MEEVNTPPKGCTPEPKTKRILLEDSETSHNSSSRRPRTYISSIISLSPLPVASTPVVSTPKNPPKNSQTISTRSEGKNNPWTKSRSSQKNSQKKAEANKTTEGKQGIHTKAGPKIRTPPKDAPSTFMATTRFFNNLGIDINQRSAAALTKVQGKLTNPRTTQGEL